MDFTLLEPTDWISIFELLSLDRAIPFYEDMGLIIPDKQRFVEMLRRLLVGGRKTHGPERGLSYRFIKKVLKTIEHQFDKHVAEHFYSWATTVFAAERSDDQRAWSIWNDLIPRRQHHLPRGLSPERWDAIAEFQKAINADDVKQRVREVKQEPLTEWDAHMYARQNYRDQDDPDYLKKEGIDPFDPVLSTIEMNRIQLAWPKLWSHFSEGEKNLFWNYGKGKIKEWGIGRNITGGLRHPNKLSRLI